MTQGKKLVLVGLGGVVVGVLLGWSLFQPKFQARAAMSKSSEEAALRRQAVALAEEEALAAAPAPAAPPMADKRREAPQKRRDKGGGGVALGGLLGSAGGPAADLAAEGAVGGEGEAEGGEGSAPTRAWFPETFLFEPRVVTDAAGEAVVPVRVPDRLTRWRVLALAHSRAGAQAGTVATFASTLPTYVDPVVPPFVRAGDVVRLPVQVVNTTDSAVSRTLEVKAQGATLEGGVRTVWVPARGSVVETVVLRAERPGPVGVKAVLGGADAVERTLEVWPVGRPVVVERGGTLAAPRTLEVEGPAEAVAGSERVRLQVFPGALGLVRSELAGVGRRGEEVAAEAYALLLAGRAPELMKALGGEVDAEALRALSMPVGQRVLRAGRAPDVPTAALLVEAALAHPNNPVLARMGERLAAKVAGAQRPDGTCQGGDGWTLQRLLVATADCARAVRAAEGSPEGKRRAAGFAVKALGAVERYRGQVKDGYTAAALLAAGVAESSAGLRDSLRQQVREALQKREDGSVVLPVSAGVVRADGEVPSLEEATALAVLALEGDKAAPLADLGTALLASYRPYWGWGDGRTNLAGLRAALALFREPLPAKVQVVLERDGKVVTQGVMEAKALREVLVLEAPAEGSGGKHTWAVRAEPAVPGLGFTLSVGAYVPWKAGGEGRGLELAVKGAREARVGQPVELEVQAAAPAGVALVVRQELPAGVQADRASLEALVREGKVSSFEVEDGAVTLKLPARSAPEPFTARLRVVPTLAGTLQAGASSVAPWGRPELAYVLPPATWTVR